MPEEKNIVSVNKTSSFIGLESYKESQAKSFFGRDSEIETLTNLVKLNTLTIVFGRSGTGKTSLLNAGVFPKLRKNYCLPFRIRLEFKEDSLPLISQVKSVLKKEIEKYKFRVGADPASYQSLWEYFHKEILWKTVTPILVFDQFEEIFTLAKENSRWAKELPEFWEELSDLIENNIPEKLKDQFLNHRDQINYDHKNQKTKIVFAFREEYLPEFESITTKIPSIKYSRFRLLPMNGYQAFEVITKTWGKNIKESEARQIVSFFTNTKEHISYDLISIEPSLLSQVCAFIDKERIDEGKNDVSADFLKNNPPEQILGSIYNQALNEANNAVPSTDKAKENINRIKIFLEEHLISRDGFRTKYTLSSTDEYLKPGIEILKNKYFIREENKILELTHDVLTPIIKKNRDERRTEIALAEEKKKAWKKAVIITIISLIVGGGAFAIFSIKSAHAISKMIIAQDSMAMAIKIKDSVEKDFKIIVHKRDSMDRASLINVKDRNEMAARILRLLDEIKLLKAQIIELSNLPIQSTGNDSILIQDLRSKIELLEIDTLNKSRLINEIDGRLKGIDIEKTNLNNQLRDKEDRIKKLESDRKLLDITVDKFSNENNRLNDELKNLRLQKAELEKRITSLEQELALNIRKINELEKQLNDAKAKILDLINGNNSSRYPGNLRIQVYDNTGPVKKPITDTVYDIYIIPMNHYNKEIAEKNSTILFSKDCSSFNKLLDKFTDEQKAYYKNGYYYFPDVIKNGKYKVKICNILDGYFNLKMPSPDNTVYWKVNPNEKKGIRIGIFR